MQAAEKANVKVAWHLEPYPGRDARSVRDDIAYINLKYGSSPAALKLGPQRNKMLYYCYDSYHLGQDDWASLLSPGGVRTVRGTAEDGVFIGLWLEKHHGREIQQGGFDGSYSYFASLGFSYGSTVSNWAAMSKVGQIQLGGSGSVAWDRLSVHRPPCESGSVRPVKDLSDLPPVCRTRTCHTPRQGLSRGRLAARTAVTVRRAFALTSLTAGRYAEC
jgi:hypothetical protein